MITKEKQIKIDLKAFFYKNTNQRRRLHDMKVFS